MSVAVVLLGMVGRKSGLIAISMTAPEPSLSIEVISPTMTPRTFTSPCLESWLPTVAVRR